MASLSVRKIDDETLVQLRVRVARHAVSMEEEARRILKQAVAAALKLPPHSIEAETTRVMLNIQAILEEAGLSFKDIVKASVFVTDINNFARINAVYATYFDEATAPARELVQVSALPRGGNVEISVIAAFD